MYADSQDNVMKQNSFDTFHLLTILVDKQV